MQECSRIPLQGLNCTQTEPVTKTMNKHHNIQIYVRTNRYKFSFLPDVVKFWNKFNENILDSAINSAETVAKFHNSIREISKF